MVEDLKLTLNLMCSKARYSGLFGCLVLE